MIHKTTSVRIVKSRISENEPHSDHSDPTLDLAVRLQAYPCIPLYIWCMF